MRTCHVSTWGKPQKFFDWFVESCRRVGLEPHNADPNDWPGAEWFNREWFRKTEAQARFVRDNRGKFDLYMFTDSYDCAFTAGWKEIVPKFLAYRSPMVCAAECFPWPKTEQAALYPQTPNRCKYLNAGGWLADAKTAEKFLNDIEKIAAKREQCDQGISVDAFLSKRFPMMLDTSCSIFFCLNIDSPSYLDFSGPRIKTTDTGQEPVMFHANGGSDLRPVLHKLYDQWHKKT